MAKKPAFLFYSNDYFEGTRTMLPEERACYIDLMVYQHQHDYIPNDLKRISMYCVGVSEATLEATLEAKFKLCEKGWYNERLQEVMNDYEEYSKDQSDNGTYGQFIKKLNQDKSIKNLTELKEFIKNEYTKQRLVEDLKINNNYEATLEALLKHRLSTRVESESESIITNSSNNTNSEISKNLKPILNASCNYEYFIEEIKKSDKNKEESMRQYKLSEIQYNNALDEFIFQNKNDDPLFIISYTDEVKHFKRWLAKNIETIKKQSTQKQNNISLSEETKQKLSAIYIASGAAKLLEKYITTRNIDEVQGINDFERAKKQNVDYMNLQLRVNGNEKIYNY